MHEPQKGPVLDNSRAFSLLAVRAKGFLLGVLDFTLINGNLPTDQDLPPQLLFCSFNGLNCDRHLCRG